MAKKKKVSAEEKSKVSSARRAKCLKELEKENENVYNKKHIWMKRKRVKISAVIFIFSLYQKIVILF